MAALSLLLVFGFCFFLRGGFCFIFGRKTSDEYEADNTQKESEKKVFPGIALSLCKF